MENIVELRNLTKSYNGKHNAVDHVNLDIPGGRIIGLLGPNGSGKTTIIKMITGLLTPTSGSIMIGNCKPGPATKAHIAYLSEHSALNRNRRIKDALYLHQDFFADFSMDRALNMLENLKIDPNAAVKTLSKGTQEKVNLILVMSRVADLYILDEPIAGVDPAARDYILKTILTNYQERSSILLSTHLISDVENILDDVIFIKEGQILMQTTVENIRETQGKSVDQYFREVFVC
ncbi:MAG: ABC transporter ATP-binding protein [Lachnospiraceae bacterium]|nr:ABC transporter ATP-binding protein [Lachnospiraceae bacterium]